jgi:hypothetical protein
VTKQYATYVPSQWSADLTQSSITKQFTHGFVIEVSKNKKEKNIS